MNPQQKIFNLSAEPEEAERDWERFAQSYHKQHGKDFDTNQKASEGFLKIFGNSHFLTRFINRHPEFIDNIFQSPYLAQNKPLKAFLFEIENFKESEFQGWMNQLRLYKYRELLRITIKDLSNYDLKEILKELSHLAIAIVRSCDQKIYNTMVKKYGPPQTKSGELCRYHLLGLGKLGGLELNYSSDVDLIAFTETSHGRASSLSINEFFIRHFQSLTNELQKQTAFGFLYRVDWDLRPEGKAGALVNSIGALENYYESFGADWERQMLTKALPVAGTLELGEEFIKRIKPFVYRKYLDIENVQSIFDIKQKIHKEVSKKTDHGFNVKLGIGGIREIEFFVQIFLLLYGGKIEAIRSSSTLDTLDKLKKQKMVSEKEANQLALSYLFLRKVEHRLQLVDEAQTHILLNDPDHQLKTARRLGYEQQEDAEALKCFMRDLEENTTKVHEIFLNLFSDTKLLPQKLQTAFLKEKLAPVVSYREDLAARFSQMKTLEEKIDIIRKFKNEKTEQIALNEKRPQYPRQDILLELSLLAEAICQETLQFATQELETLYGAPLSHQADSDSETETRSYLVALSMGKLGGEEINYASDLDLIFIYSDNGQTSGPKVISNSEFFARLVQKFISILSVPTRFGRAYEIDTELRPSGHSGPLVTTLENFLDYQKNLSQAWERQALLKARPIAGPVHLTRLISQHLRALLFDIPLKPDTLTEMHRLRLRVEREIANEDAEYFDFKLGLGGIMDIEFILQYYQLKFGKRISQCVTPNTFEGLDKLFLYDLLPQKSYALILKEIYTFYRSMGAKISLRLKRGVHRLSINNETLNGVARDLGFHDENGLLQRYFAYRKKVRHIYNEVFTNHAG